MARTIVFKSHVKRAAGVSKEAWESGLRSITRDVKADIQDLISTPYPPASEPGKAPHLRSGKLQRGITVVVEKATKGRAAALVVKAGVEYGAYLETGTRKMIRRPYASTVLTSGRGRSAKTLKKKWRDKISSTARKKSKVAAKGTRKRR